MNGFYLYKKLFDRINPSTILQRRINLSELRCRQDFKDIFSFPVSGRNRKTDSAFSGKLSADNIKFVAGDWVFHFHPSKAGKPGKEMTKNKKTDKQ